MFHLSFFGVNLGGWFTRSLSGVFAPLWLLHASFRNLFSRSILLISLHHACFRFRRFDHSKWALTLQDKLDDLWCGFRLKRTLDGFELASRSIKHLRYWEFFFPTDELSNKKKKAINSFPAPLFYHPHSLVWNINDHSLTTSCSSSKHLIRIQHGLRQWWALLDQFPSHLPALTTSRLCCQNYKERWRFVMLYCSSGDHGNRTSKAIDGAKAFWDQGWIWSCRSTSMFGITLGSDINNPTFGTDDRLCGSWHIRRRNRTFRGGDPNWPFLR